MAHQSSFSHNSRQPVLARPAGVAVRLGLGLVPLRQRVELFDLGFQLSDLLIQLPRAV